MQVAEHTLLVYETVIVIFIYIDRATRVYWTVKQLCRINVQKKSCEHKKPKNQAATATTLRIDMVTASGTDISASDCEENFFKN